MKKCKTSKITVSGTISKSTQSESMEMPDTIFIGKRPSVPQIMYSDYSSISGSNSNSNSTNTNNTNNTNLPVRQVPKELPPFSNGPRLYPVYVQPPPSDGMSGNIKYTIQPRIFLSFSNKKFKVGSKAKVSYSGEESIITNIGPKQILLRSRLENKEKRIPLQNFIEFNK